MTHTDIQNKIDAGETNIELPSEEIQLPIPLVPYQRALQFNGKGRKESMLVPTTRAIASNGVSITLNGVGIRGALPTSTGVTLNGAGSDIQFSECGFYNLYDAIVAEWDGGFVRGDDTRFEGIGRRAILGRSLRGYWAIQLVGSYFDGRQSEGLIYVDGSLAGGVMVGNWMQASKCHLYIDGATPRGPVGEFVIGANMFDQDSASTAAIRIIGNGQPYQGASSNCIKVTGNYIQSISRAVLMDSPANVSIDNNRIRWSGDEAAIEVVGTRAAEVDITNNPIQFWGGNASAAIKLLSVISEGVRVKGNTGRAFNGALDFIQASGSWKDVGIKDNDPGQGYRQLISSTATGNGEAIIRNNSPYNSPYAQSTMSGTTMTLPVIDESQVVGVGSGTVERIVGLTARQGVRITMISASQVQFRKPSMLVDGSIGVDFNMEAFKPCVLLKFQDNLWYPLS